MKTAGLYIRVVAAWLIAMQPLIGAYAAQAANAPLAMELCRGAPAPSGKTPAPPDRLHACCPAACAQTGAPVPAVTRIAAPAVHTVAAIAPAESAAVSAAPYGLRLARAPPFSSPSI